MSHDEANRLIVSKVAEILDEMACDIEHIGAGLCADPHVAEHHAARLQGIDLMSQTARGLAGVLRSHRMSASVAELGLQDLQERLSGAELFEPFEPAANRCPACAAIAQTVV